MAWFAPASTVRDLLEINPDAEWLEIGPPPEVDMDAAVVRVRDRDGRTLEQRLVSTTMPVWETE